MSRNKTCPISNFRLDESSEGMSFLLPAHAGFNLEDVSPLQLRKKLVELHRFSFSFEKVISLSWKLEKAFGSAPFAIIARTTVSNSSVCQCLRTAHHCWTPG